MKGLFVKDFKFLKLQKKFFLVILAVEVLLVFEKDDPSFALGFIPFDWRRLMDFQRAFGSCFQYR